MKKVLVQLDTDQHPSPFDAIVAYDAAVDVLLSYGSVTPEQVKDLVPGEMTDAEEVAMGKRRAPFGIAIGREIRRGH